MIDRVQLRQERRPPAPRLRPLQVRPPYAEPKGTRRLQLLHVSRRSRCRRLLRARRPRHQWHEQLRPRRMPTPTPASWSTCARATTAAVTPTRLAGLRFQRKLEAKAFQVGGSNNHAPAQLVGDLLAETAPRPSSARSNPATGPEYTSVICARCSPSSSPTSSKGDPADRPRVPGFERPDARPHRRRDPQQLHH